MAQHAHIAQQDINQFYVVYLGIMLGVLHAPFVYVIGSYMFCTATFRHKRENASAAAAIEDTLLLQVERKQLRHNHLCCLVCAVAKSHVLVYGDGERYLLCQFFCIGADGVVDGAVRDYADSLEHLFLVF